MFEVPDIPFLKEVVLFLVATVVIVPLFHRLRVSPVLGFLAVGVLIGPSGVGLVDDPDGVRALAQLGVVFLLFTVGLELSYERLWAMRRHVFGLGALQVLVTAVAIGVIAFAWGNSAPASVIVGAALALSSTAVVLQLLVEHGEIGSRLGRVTFGVLLFQDLAVVPLLFIVTVLGGGEGPLLPSLGIALGRALIAIIVIFLLGRWLLRPLFRAIAGEHSRELFMATTLLAILVTASITGATGLSMALGAFLAGLLLAETEFHHQVEADIQPFRGLLLSLFFISVGMGIDFGAAADLAFWIVASVFGLIGIKAIIAAALCQAFGLPRDVTTRASLLLGPGGEFAFVVVGAAMAQGLLGPAAGQFFLIVAGLSLAVTPFCAILGQRLAPLLTPREERRHLAPRESETADLTDHVLIAGFGRVGQTVARMLDAQKIPFLSLDLDARRVARQRKRGVPVYYGDASRTEVLERIGAARASVAVVTMDDPTAAGRAVANIARTWPDLPTFARARNIQHSQELVAAGATLVIPETLESSMQLAGQVIHALGTPMDAVNQILEEIREAGYVQSREP
ncbi:MAG: monovalent cation:proton antiporter-2 (CPA2) family protein [Alphaproteobacteria bacterium]